MAMCPWLPILLYRKVCEKNVVPPFEDFKIVSIPYNLFFVLSSRTRFPF